MNFFEIMKLEEYLNINSLTKTKFSLLVGVSQSHISNILLGKKNPSLALAKYIEEITKGSVTIYELINPKSLLKFKKKNETN